MQPIRSGSNELAEVLAQVHPASRSYVTVGVFDGVHRGHQQIITEMVEAAHSTQAVAIAITFTPHPGTALGYQTPPLLTTVDERVDLLAALGLDAVVVLPFTPATAYTSATEFIELLLHHLHLAILWGGPDFAFGHRREGNISFLQRLGAERGFTVHTVEPLMWEGAPVNSSRVRTALQAGNIVEASGCLGRPYRLTGAAVLTHEGRYSIGGLVARLSSSPDRLIPAAGVYACVAHTEHRRVHQAVVNVSTPVHPTEQPLAVEAHLLDLYGDLQGQALTLDFIARLRDARSFSASEALVEQAHKDIAQARNLLGEVSATTN